VHGTPYAGYPVAVSRPNRVQIGCGCGGPQTRPNAFGDRDARFGCVGAWSGASYARRNRSAKRAAQPSDDGGLTVELGAGGR